MPRVGVIRLIAGSREPRRPDSAHAADGTSLAHCLPMHARPERGAARTERKEDGSMKSIEEGLKDRLMAERSAWESRLAAIRHGRRHDRVPLDPDFDDQAIQLENDETLESLDVRGRQALAEIDATLARLREGTYGTCAKCGESIPEARLRARPTAPTCVACSAAVERT